MDISEGRESTSPFQPPEQASVSAQDPTKEHLYTAYTFIENATMTPYVCMVVGRISIFFTSMLIMLKFEQVLVLIYLLMLKSSGMQIKCYCGRVSDPGFFRILFSNFSGSGSGFSAHILDLDSRRKSYLFEENITIVIEDLQKLKRKQSLIKNYHKIDGKFQDTRV